MRYADYPHWIHDREAVLEREAQAQRLEREARAEAQRLEDERLQHRTAREEKMERLKAVAATTPCPACGSREKSFAALLSTGLMARCQDCGLDWQEIDR